MTAHIADLDSIVIVPEVYDLLREQGPIVSGLIEITPFTIFAPPFIPVAATLSGMGITGQSQAYQNT
jgi:hypothetical protein